jgi:HSP20 family protein
MGIYIVIRPLKEVFLVKDRNAQFARWHRLARQFLGEDFFTEIMHAAEKEEPAVDVFHGPNEVIVVINLPGIENVHTLEMRVEGETLWIKGQIPNPYEGYHVSLSERKKGEFQKTIPLGVPVSKRFTSARYRKGILEIRFPIPKQPS